MFSYRVNLYQDYTAKLWLYSKSQSENITLTLKCKVEVKMWVLSESHVRDHKLVVSVRLNINEGGAKKSSNAGDTTLWCSWQSSFMFGLASLLSAFT